ncbi:response regulator [Flavobacterium caeni]|uniref:Response regulator receiver domain-containing protein n=1 Tax=Flavobacterium caeni TaxID=490189 RepID=A0A1G5IVR2_9FLAO|nr:response regulator [Flavobacterium caeni]SCY80107.1 Response regulator receiver domain-containing protein [Flavobacterium caeni]
MKRFKLIYLIDDDEIFVFVMQKLMQKSGRFEQVLNIANGLDAIDVLVDRYSREGSLPDLIFLDLNMPVLDGWQFLDEVERLPFKDRLRIYIISSSIDAREMAKAKEYSTVKRFVSKPVTLDWLNKID